MAKNVIFNMAAAAILDFCTMLILAVNLTVGPHFQPMFQIWCKCVQKWQSYGSLTFFKMAAAAILNLLPVSMFSIWSSLDSGWVCSCKISCLYVNIWLSY